MYSYVYIYTRNYFRLIFFSGMRGAPPLRLVEFHTNHGIKSFPAESSKFIVIIQTTVMIIITTTRESCELSVRRRPYRR